MLMENLTWKQVERYLKRRKDIIIPIGSTEEHGYHLPLATDTIIAERIAEEVGEKTGVLVAPSIGYGICRHTAPYPGTAGVGFDSMRGFVQEILEDLRAKGFRTFYLLTGHAGSTHRVALKEAAGALVARGAKVHLIVPYEVPIEDLLESKLEFWEYPVGHADEIETSLMLYLRPDLVDMRKAIDEVPEREIFETSTSKRPTKSGVFGKPSIASRQKGMKIFERMVGEIAKFIASTTEPIKRRK
jgi:creatinine amidohydrolase